MTTPFRVQIVIAADDLRKLRQLGGDPGAHIGTAVRTYLKRHAIANPGVPLPFESGAGRLGQGSMKDLSWTVPDDIRTALSWGDGTGSHIRAAIAQYLVEYWSPRLAKDPPPAPKPAPPAKMDIEISVELVQRLVALGGSIDEHFRKAVRAYSAKYREREREENQQFPHETAYSRDIVPGEGTSVTVITWALPEGWRISPEFVRAALREYVSTGKARQGWADWASEKVSRLGGPPQVGDRVKLAAEGGGFFDPQTNLVVGPGQMVVLTEPVGRLTRAKIKGGGLVKA